MNCFWRLRRETSPDAVIKSACIVAEIDCICIEPDVGLAIVQAVDDHYRTLYAKEMNRKKAQK